MPRLTRWGGHGYAHIFANVVPMIRTQKTLYAITSEVGSRIRRL